MIEDGLIEVKEQRLPSKYSCKEIIKPGYIQVESKEVSGDEDEN